MRGSEAADGRRPDDVADDAISDLGPVFLQHREELPELGDCHLRVVQVPLELRQVRCRLFVAALRLRRVPVDALLQDGDGVV